jgi:hypothetical protein
MTLIHRDHSPTPYNDALDHLGDEIEWITARCRHLGACIEADREAADHAGLATATTDGDRVSDDTRQKIARLATDEDNLRQQIDLRVEVTEAEGRTLPLRMLRDKFQLSDAETYTLLLAVVPCLGLDLYETLSSIGQFGFGFMAVSPEMVAVFTGLDLAGRVRLRDQLDDMGKLVQAGLIEPDWDDDRVSNFWPASIHLTEVAYCRLVGKVMVTFDPDNLVCPLCDPTTLWVDE